MLKVQLDAVAASESPMLLKIIGQVAASEGRAGTTASRQAPFKRRVICSRLEG
jgi:hypothetical protein